MADGGSGSRSWQGFVAERDGSRPTDADAFALHMRNLHRPPTLDVDVASHCNLNCASCCHFSPIAEPAFLSLEDYERDLGKLAGIPGIGGFFEAICLMGGEPLLHPDLPAFIRMTHAYLPDAQVRVVSNGVLLSAMGSEFWDAMRASGADLLLTTYPIGIDYGALVELAASHGIDAWMGGGISEADDTSFFLRTPLDERGLQDRSRAFVECPLGGVTMQLLDGRIYPCNRGALAGIVNARFGTAFAHEPDDYLELDAIDDVAQIDALRRRSHPMCRYCASSIAERIAWRQSTCDRYEWLMRPDEQKPMGA